MIITQNWINICWVIKNKRIEKTWHLVQLIQIQESLERDGKNYIWLQKIFKIANNKNNYKIALKLHRKKQRFVLFSPTHQKQEEEILGNKC